MGAAQIIPFPQAAEIKVVQTRIPVYDAGSSASMPGGLQPPGAGAAASQQVVNFHFVGTSISMDQMVNEFLPRFEEAVSNGAGSGAVKFNVTVG